MMLRRAKANVCKAVKMSTYAFTSITYKGIIVNAKANVTTFCTRNRNAKMTRPQVKSVGIFRKFLIYTYSKLKMSAMFRPLSTVPTIPRSIADHLLFSFIFTDKNGFNELPARNK